MTWAISRISVVGVADKTRLLITRASLCPADGPGDRPCNKAITQTRNGFFSCGGQPLTAVAQVYAGQGKHVEAEPVYLQALKVYQTVHGEFHADVAATLNNLRVLHRVYGQHAQAEPLLTRAVAIKEKLLGLDHPDVALSVVNLAQLRVVQEQPEKTEPLYRRSLATRERALGSSHQRSRRHWRTLPMSCGNEAVQTRRSHWSCVPKIFARSGVEPAAPSSVAYPLWRCTTSRLPSNGARTG